jgi:hypothetical protein
VVSFPHVFLPKPYTRLSPIPNTPHVPPISFLLILSPAQQILFYLFSRLYDVFTSSCAHFAIMLSSSYNCFYLSNLLPVTPFLPSFL